MIPSAVSLLSLHSIERGSFFLLIFLWWMGRYKSSILSLEQEKQILKVWNRECHLPVVSGSV